MNWCLLPVVTLVAALAGNVAAHGNIVEPEAVWVGTYASSGFSAELDPVPVFGKVDNQKFGYGQEGNIKAFAAAFPQSPYKSIKELIMDKQKVLTQYKGTPECGYTIKDEAKRVVLPPQIKFSGLAHGGPCEIWCDNTKVMYELDCQTKFGERNTVIPFDNTKCKGADQFTFYWLGMTGEPWQVYITCLWLQGASSSGGGGAAPSPALPSNGTTTTAPRTEAPAPRTPAPVPTTATPKPAVPPPTTAAPRSTTKAPVGGEATTPSKNCKRRGRRE